MKQSWKDRGFVDEPIPAGIDIKNEITLYYSQAVIASPARPLQSDYIEAAKLDLGLEAYVEEMWKESVNPLAGPY